MGSRRDLERAPVREHRAAAHNSSARCAASEATATIARAVGFETELERTRADRQAWARHVGGPRPHGAARRRRLARPSSRGRRGEPGNRRDDHSRQGTLAGAVMLSDSAEVVPDLASRMGHGLEPIAGRARSALLALLGFRDRARGVLVAFDRMGSDAPFDHDDQHLLNFVCRERRDRDCHGAVRRGRPAAALNPRLRGRASPLGQGASTTRRCRSSAR